MNTTIVNEMSLRNERLTRPIVRTAPSLRVPVTMQNREYLRRIRQAELDAWRIAPGGTLCRAPGSR